MQCGNERTAGTEFASNLVLAVVELQRSVGVMMERGDMSCILLGCRRRRQCTATTVSSVVTCYLHLILNKRNQSHFARDALPVGAAAG